MREQSLGTISGAISIDGQLNGGISVKGCNRGGIFVRAQVQTSALSQSEAEELARQVQVFADGARIRAEGPPRDRDHNWSVSYEVFVPNQSDLSLRTHNGGIGISDVHGRIELEALNGGIHLRRLAGYVTGSTTNGGLNIELDGQRWNGETLDVRTINGGVTLGIPEDYSAQIETGTINGRLKVDFPVTMQGRLDRHISMKLGYGGPLVRVTTTNGGVHLQRKS
jgi:hypothetical protein